MGKIFYIMGKSSSGKDTIYKRIFKDMETKLKNIVGYTTRPIRQGETEGKEYHFVSVSEMEKMQAEGRVIELRAYNTVHGVWNYFTCDDGQIDLDNENYLLIGTLESYVNIRKYFGKGKLVPIYIYVDDGVRLQRALDREKLQENPKYAEMCRRFLADEKDFSKENIENAGIDYKFENDELEECIHKITEFIESRIER